MKKYRNQLNEKGLRHAALEIVKNTNSLFTLNIGVYLDIVENKLISSDSYSYEMSSLETKSKNPYLIQFKKEHFDYLEIEENEEY